jgi:small subunit ribosomal protein S8
MTDPIADMLARGSATPCGQASARRIPASRLKAEIAKILQDEGYINAFKLVERSRSAGASAPRSVIRIFLKYGPHGERVISGIERVSRPGRRVYFGPHGCAAGARRSRHQHPHDVAGVMTGREAVKAGVGGEVLCNVW